jgi:hypothetical protein
MIAAFRYELRRLATLRSSRRIPVVAILLAAGCGMASALAVSADSDPRTASALRLAAAVPILVAAALLGTASSGHEYRYAMRSVTLAVVPRRTRLAIAKAAVIAAYTAPIGALASVATAEMYSLGIDWAYAGDYTLVPADAIPAAITAGLVPAAAAAVAAGLLGLAIGWLIRWYRTAVTAAVAVVAFAVPIAAGWLARLPGVADALGTAEDSLRTTPTLDGLLNPQVLAAWPNLPRLATGLHVAEFHATPPTSLATTALLAAVALIAVVAGAFRWQRG